MPKEPNLHNFIQPLKEVTLEPEKAHQMRAVLSAYADLHSVPVRSGRYLSPLSFSPRMWGVLVTVFILLVSGTGVSFASQNALPGQPLYLVKTKVAEPIQGALAVTPLAQAKWQSELADRRLSEASELAAQNQLNATTTTYIQTQVDQNVAQANAAATKVADAGDADAALSVRATLSASLAAHADVLSLITPRLAAAGDATTTTHVLALLQDVRKAQGTLAADRVRTAIAVADTVHAKSAKTHGEVAVQETTSISGANASSTETITVALAEPAAQAGPTMAPTHAQTLFRAHIESLLQSLPTATTSTSTASTTASTTEKTATTTTERDESK